MITTQPNFYKVQCPFSPIINNFLSLVLQIFLNEETIESYPTSGLAKLYVLADHSFVTFKFKKDLGEKGKEYS